MENPTNEKIKIAMAQMKYVKSGLLGLYYYWTKPMEAHRSLREAEILKISDELLKIEDIDIKLTRNGFNRNYNDSAIEVLKQIPDNYFYMNTMGHIYAYSLKVKKPSKRDEYVKARVSLFRGIDVPQDIVDQEVLFDDNFSSPEDEQ